MPFFGPFLAQNDVFRFGLVWFTKKPLGMVLMVWNHYPPIGEPDPGPKTPSSEAFLAIFKAIFSQKWVLTVREGSFP